MVKGKNKVADLSSADYVHLHNHTHYSLLDGLQKIGPMLDHVKELGMESVAITDHGTLSGLIEFYKEGAERGVKTILGMEGYVAARTHRDKEPIKDKQNYHITLLAMNNEGYQNLMQLSTIANLDGFYYRPRIDHSLLEKFNEGLIVLSGCIGSEIGDLLRQNQYEMALEKADWYKKTFPGRYYIELQDHGHPDHPSRWDEQTAVNEKLLKLASELELPCVVTCDAHYLKHEDQEAHEILLCVQTGSYLSDENRMSLKNFELHLTDPDEIIKRWGKTHPEVISNTRKIADSCDVKIELGKILIPKFPVPKGENEKSFLEKLVYQGLAWRYKEIPRNEISTMSKSEAINKLPKEVLERTKYELSVVDQMGFNGYFLIISDFINWGKDRGIVFGPGRGSAAGSIIAYALNITTIDPLKYDLLFERFLNPDRVSMPDIDIDIQDTRRDEVIQYCVEKYGAERVANIVTFGKMAARNAVRDVARVLQVPYTEADRMAKMIPPPIQGRHIPLEISLEQNADLKAEYLSSEVSKRVFDLAVRVEGTIRSHGVHAAGVVIAPDDIVKFAPLEMAQKGVVTTQYSMGPIEDLGLLKMDFLGLSNLTIIKNTLRIVKRVEGIDIDINTLSLDDKKTYELLQRGDTTGVFQFESSGMKRYLKDLKPTEFDDIVAMGALYRPGPLSAGLTDMFIKRKNGQQKVTYDHPSMKAALENTYGVLVYQEQFMQISRDVCGFTGGEADTLRKAIGKKKRDVMAKMETRFIEGAIEHSGISREKIEEFWKKLLGFADYCFNKSHSACYGMISYWTAYLKAHYPAAFMAALMTSDADDTDRLSIEMSECVHQGIAVLPPDVNQSFVEFAVVPGENAIRFGMAAIKNIGTGAVEEIIRAREKAGGFKSIEDFFSHVNGRVVNRKVVESLIKTGAFDSFGERVQLLDNIESMLSFSSKKQKELDSGQVDFFGDNLDKKDDTSRISLAPAYSRYEKRDQLQWEKELLGLYLSEHPLQDYRLFLSEKTNPINTLKASMHEQKAIVGGNITNTRVITTKSGKQMAFIRLSDETNDIEVVVFPKVYEQAPSLWQIDNIVVVEGKVDALARDGSASEEFKIIASKVRELTHEHALAYKSTGKIKSQPTPKAVPMAKKDQRLFIRVIDANQHQQLEQLKTVLDSNSGNYEVVLVTGENKKVIKIPYKLDISETALREVADIFGAQNVKLH
ncbi:MAG: DNA polymerase III subunit alpha [bacterium]|nr:DNA polymerase III subunit alpha [bacterium]